MSNKKRSAIPLALLVALVMASTFISSRHHADTGPCGGQSISLPFTDVMSSPFFCQIAEAFVSGLISGTSATTYGPSDPVTRDQAAAFITSAQDSALRRGGKRAALGQFWTTTPHYDIGLGSTNVGGTPGAVKSDGADLWVVRGKHQTVTRVRASDGQILGRWTGAFSSSGVLVAMGRIFVTGETEPGSLFMIDPAQPPGPVTEVSGNQMPLDPTEMAFDGTRIWAVAGPDISIVTPAAQIPWSFRNVHGFGATTGILFDGSNMWVTDQLQNALLKLDRNAGIVQTVAVGKNPLLPVFDGTNIWVPNKDDNTISVVRAATGDLIATLTGNGLNGPEVAAFDGLRVLVTNTASSTLSLWRSADLTPLGSFSTGHFTLPFGACSDGVNFWITLRETGQLVRF